MSTQGVSRGRFRTALLATTLLGSLVFALPSAVAAKKSGRVNVTKQVNQQIPDAAPGADGLYGVMSSTIRLGSKFSGRRIRDVNLTLQTTGDAPNAGDDVFFILRAPNGATSQVLFSGAETQSIGPLTFDDESPLTVGADPCVDPTSLCPPFAGSAQPSSGLYVLDNGRVKGTWTLTAGDFANNNTSILNFWRLNVAARKPFLTK